MISLSIKIEKLLLTRMIENTSGRGRYYSYVLTSPVLKIMFEMYWVKEYKYFKSKAIK